jgi:hypothetical protein
VKELDFLPEWYKHDQRRQMHVRHQYGALVLVFLVMMTFNVTAIHRAGKASAEGTRLENQRVGAETVVQEFDTLTKRLNDLKTRADLVEQVDSRIDIAAILAELSHLMGDSIVLRKVEIQAEPFRRAGDQEPSKSSAVRLVDRPATSEKEMPLGRVKFRIVLTGVAAHTADVPDLVCRLDGSSYFQRVHLGFCGTTRGQAGTRSAPPAPEGGTTVKTPSASDVTDFEIACTLANYKEVDD